MRKTAKIFGAREPSTRKMDAQEAWDTRRDYLERKSKEPTTSTPKAMLGGAALGGGVGAAAGALLGRGRSNIAPVVGVLGGSGALAGAELGFGAAKRDQDNVHRARHQINLQRKAETAYADTLGRVLESLDQGDLKARLDPEWVEANRPTFEALRQHSQDGRFPLRAIALSARNVKQTLSQQLLEQQQGVPMSSTKQAALGPQAVRAYLASILQRPTVQKALVGAGVGAATGATLADPGERWAGARGGAAAGGVMGGLTPYHPAATGLFSGLGSDYLARRQADQRDQLMYGGQKMAAADIWNPDTGEVFDPNRGTAAANRDVTLNKPKAPAPRKKRPFTMADYETSRKRMLSLMTKRGHEDALHLFGVEKEAFVRAGANLLGQGMRAGGKALSFLPTGIGNAAGATLGGIGGGLQGAASGGGVKGAVSGAVSGAAAGAMPFGAGLVAEPVLRGGLNRMMGVKQASLSKEARIRGLLQAARGMAGSGAQRVGQRSQNFMQNWNQLNKRQQYGRAVGGGALMGGLGGALNADEGEGFQGALRGALLGAGVGGGGAYATRRHRLHQLRGQRQAGFQQ